MNYISNTSQNMELSDFLTKHNAKDLKAVSTHTRIKCDELNIYGGSFHIEKEELPLFYKLYYENVFVKKRKEYLTEKQLPENGPILVDFDFRYSYDVMERKHTPEHIEDIIQLYLETLKELFVFKEGEEFPIFIMEKPNINRVPDKQITKDGIHMIIGIQMDHTLQVILRDKILEKIGEVWELPLINDLSSVLDEGISKGVTNWQMYGSQKPGNEAYRLTYYLTASIDTTDNEFMTVPHSVKDFDLSKNLPLLSAQYAEHVKFDIHPKIMEEYNRKHSNKPKKSVSSKNKINMVFEIQDTDGCNAQDIQLEDITNATILKKAVDNIMQTLNEKEYSIREIHEYTQILPAKYYEPGSHVLNRKVAFALKHKDERLFLSWVMLRSKASDFDYSSIPKLYHDWTRYFHNSNHPEEITTRSIMYWAKQDAFEEYEKIKKSSIDYFLEETLHSTAEFDFATVLYYMFKDKYVCTSITNKIWYIFKNNRWELDTGNTLRLAISRDMFMVYQEKMTRSMADIQNYETNEEAHEKIQKKMKKIAEVSVRLKKTNDKNNIMREAMELFYDKEFIINMDQNKYLLCFSNGVIDFKNKMFRQGYPQDYITKSTKIPYVPYDEKRPSEMKDISIEITRFMEQLFPIPSLNRYMWDHLASTLIGEKKEQVFNIYRGSGSNGKSLLTDLMSKSLGEYQGVMPITYLTEKRQAVGGTSSEVMQIKGIRYAVMNEPSKDSVINEGKMKEITGGDPITARALYCESETFKPQCSLVVCTNSLFEIKSNDDGTWRRLKLVDFLSKFVGEGETHTDDTPYVFPKDKGLKDKLPIWAPVFVSMLVKRAFETDGEVIDCPEVISASNKYRQEQDQITGFMNEKIIKVQGKTLGKREINETFKEWYQSTYGNRKMPKLTELEEAMNKKYGMRNSKTNKWLNVTIQYDDERDALEELDDEC